MKTMNRILLGAAVVMFSVSCTSNSGKPVEDTSVKVDVYSPVKLSEDGIFVSGVVSAKQTAMISTRYMGFVDKVYVKQGDKVSKGQLLVSINSDDLRAKKLQAEAMVSEAEAAAGNAQKDYERYKILHEKKSVSDKEFENMELNYTSMNAKLKMARQGLLEVKSMLAYMNIRAPFSGVVTQKMIDEGSTASPGMPLMSIEQSGNMDVRSSIPETYIKYIKVGDPVKIDIKSTNIKINGVVSELSPSAADTGGQYEMKIAINAHDKESLRAGMYAGIYISGTGEKVMESKILIEKSSLVLRDQLTVFMLAGKDNDALLRWIRLGKDFGNQVEVLSGINVDEKIIRNPSDALYNGKKIIISNK